MAGKKNILQRIWWLIRFLTIRNGLPLFALCLLVLIGLMGYTLSTGVFGEDEVIRQPRLVNSGPSGNIYFIFYTYENGYTFSYAANTLKNEIMSGPAFRAELDNMIYKPVATKRDFLAAWRHVHLLSQALGQQVRAGHLFFHSGFDDDGKARITKLLGPKGPVPRRGFSKVEEDDIARLDKLNWAEDSSLYLYGCRSGVTYGGTHRCLAEIFLSGQDVGKVYGQTGWTSFSYRKEKFVRIKSYIGDRLPIYLWAYGTVYNESLDAPPGYEEPETRWAARVFLRDENRQIISYYATEN